LKHFLPALSLDIGGVRAYLIVILALAWIDC